MYKALSGGNVLISRSGMFPGMRSVLGSSDPGLTKYSHDDIHFHCMPVACKSYLRNDRLGRVLTDSQLCHHPH